MSPFFIRISTHTPLAGRDYYKSHQFHDQYISTHTPLAGRDLSETSENPVQNISTHTPLAGRDGIGMTTANDILNFYSHAPRGARRAGSRDKACTA